MSWEAVLEDSISTVDDLAEYLVVNEKDKAILEEICQDHPLRISKYYLSLIDASDEEDPIRRLSIPLSHESYLEGSYDTSGEKYNTVLPGLQHKYEQTAVILSTNECAMYCRHCFRKRLVGVDNNEVVQDIQPVKDYIQGHREINNVLITGGDPFVLSNDRIEEFLTALTEIDHLDFIRFGTRVPVTFPKRILSDHRFVEMLESYTNKTRLYVVTQFNHPREITEESTKACNRLQDIGITISNQTVLLRGVNDDSSIMTQLQRNLVRIGIIPYYVFQCRPVKRVKKHFQVPLYDGCRIIQETRKKLDGHTKRFRFIMSHPTGKVEILGMNDEKFFFKYHQAKNSENVGTIFSRPVDRTSTWLDDLEEH
ncbi:MAG: KamA family radical SAM protein [Candidatus Thorarchaeota archaeon]